MVRDLLGDRNASQSSFLTKIVWIDVVKIQQPHARWLRYLQCTVPYVVKG